MFSLLTLNDCAVFALLQWSLRLVDSFLQLWSSVCNHCKCNLVRVHLELCKYIFYSFLQVFIRRMLDTCFSFNLLCHYCSYVIGEELRIFLFFLAWRVDRQKLDFAGTVHLSQRQPQQLQPAITFVQLILFLLKVAYVAITKLFACSARQSNLANQFRFPAATSAANARQNIFTIYTSENLFRLKLFFRQL